MNKTQTPESQEQKPFLADFRYNLGWVNNYLIAVENTGKHAPTETMSKVITVGSNLVNAVSIMKSMIEEIKREGNIDHVRNETLIDMATAAINTLDSDRPASSAFLGEAIGASIYIKCAEICKQWADARMPDYGGNALNNCAEHIKAQVPEDAMQALREFGMKVAAARDKHSAMGYSDAAYQVSDEFIVDSVLNAKS